MDPQPLGRVHDAVPRLSADHVALVQQFSEPRGKSLARLKRNTTLLTGLVQFQFARSRVLRFLRRNRQLRYQPPQWSIHTSWITATLLKLERLVPFLELRPPGLWLQHNAPCGDVLPVY